MGEIRPWQIGVFILAIVAVGAAVWYTFMANDPGRHLEKSVLLVDVENGQLWRVSTKRRGIILPAKSPDTGRYTLYSVDDSEEPIKLNPRFLNVYREFLESEDANGVETVVDPETGLFEPRKPIKTYTRD